MGPCAHRQGDAEPDLFPIRGRRGMEGAKTEGGMACVEAAEGVLRIGEG